MRACVLLALAGCGGLCLVGLVKGFVLSGGRAGLSSSSLPRRGYEPLFSAVGPQLGDDFEAKRIFEERQAIVREMIVRGLNDVREGLIKQVGPLSSNEYIEGVQSWIEEQTLDGGDTSFEQVQAALHRRFASLVSDATAPQGAKTPKEALESPQPSEAAGDTSEPPPVLSEGISIFLSAQERMREQSMASGDGSSEDKTKWMPLEPLPPKVADKWLPAEMATELACSAEQRRLRKELEADTESAPDAATPVPTHDTHNTYDAEAQVVEAVLADVEEPPSSAGEGHAPVLQLEGDAVDWQAFKMTAAERIIEEREEEARRAETEAALAHQTRAALGEGAGADCDWQALRLSSVDRLQQERAQTHREETERRRLAFAADAATGSGGVDWGLLRNGVTEASRLAAELKSLESGLRQGGLREVLPKKRADDEALPVSEAVVFAHLNRERRGRG